MEKYDCKFWIAKYDCKFWIANMIAKYGKNMIAILYCKI
jgi:hypothetical protein